MYRVSMLWLHHRVLLIVLTTQYLLLSTYLSRGWMSFCLEWCRCIYIEYHHACLNNWHHLEVCIHYNTLDHNNYIARFESVTIYEAGWTITWVKTVRANWLNHCHWSFNQPCVSPTSLNTFEYHDNYVVCTLLGYVFVVYASRAHLNNHWTDTCALLLVGVACAFEMVSHVQQSVSSVRRAMYVERVWGSEWGFKHYHSMVIS